MSPTLFTLITVDLINQVKERFKDVSILMYADDVALTSRDLGRLQLALSDVAEWAEPYNLRINVDKTKAQKFRRGGRLGRSDVLKLGSNNVDFVASFTYLGVTLSTPGLSFSQHICERARKAIVCARVDVKNPRVLSLSTGLRLFDVKVAPMATYAIQVIWPYLKLKDLETLDRVKTMYLKRAMGLPRTSRNRLVYHLAGCQPFVMSLHDALSLPHTTPYDQFVANFYTKCLEIHPLFFETPAMVDDFWKQPCFERRHLFTRHSVHGFHHVLCKNKSFHDAGSECFCRYCHSSCGLYHFFECERNPLSLAQAGAL